eukprot:m.164389 g.164389  ORF g.164389 m.164389 type:complete len:140 (+) comp38874_c0_seq5:348-767(+)
MKRLQANIFAILFLFLSLPVYLDTQLKLKISGSGFAVLKGKTFIITCTITYKSNAIVSPLSFSWFLNGVSITKDSYPIRNFPKNSKIYNKTATTADNGNYTCQVAQSNNATVESAGWLLYVTGNVSPQHVYNYAKENRL